MVTGLVGADMGPSSKCHRWLSSTAPTAYGSDSAAPTSPQLSQPPPHQLRLGPGLRQVGLAFSHHLRRRLTGEVGIGEAPGQACDLLFDLGQIFLQPLPQGIEAMLGHG